MVQQRYILPTQQEVTEAGDELWVRANGSRITIDSMHEQHAKNALRKIIRMVRTGGQIPEWMQQAMEQARNEEGAGETKKEHDDEWQPVFFRVAEKGAPVISSAQERKSELRLTYLDMVSKRCKIVGWSWDFETKIPSLHLEAGEDSLNLDPTVPREAITEVAFPEFKDWRIVATDSSRYNVMVVFRKED